MLRSLIFVLFFTFLLPATAANVNINTASAQQLSDGLVGIGIKKAKAIVQYRKKHGKFKSVSDLADVKGIGKSTIKKNKSSLSLKGSNSGITSKSNSSKTSKSKPSKSSKSKDSKKSKSSKKPKSKDKKKDKNKK